VDIEAEITKELADIRKPSTKPLFTSVKLDTQCRKPPTRPTSAHTDTRPSDVLPDTFACRTRVFCREDLPRIGGRCTAAELSVREATDPNYGDRQSNSEGSRGCCESSACATFSWSRSSRQKSEFHVLYAVLWDTFGSSCEQPLTHCDPQFAIRPSIRNNTELTRDEVIKTVAGVVGPGHKVDLGGYDLLILVEIYKASLVLCNDACDALTHCRTSWA
jgi:tRNA acetyltransferase TAN1